MNILTYLRTKARYLAEDLGASEEGATATEYVFLLVFIALAIIVGAGLLGTAINDRFSTAATSVTTGSA